MPMLRRGGFVWAIQRNLGDLNGKIVLYKHISPSAEVFGLIFLDVRSERGSPQRNYHFMIACLRQVIFFASSLRGGDSQSLKLNTVHFPKAVVRQWETLLMTEDQSSLETMDGPSLFSLIQMKLLATHRRSGWLLRFGRDFDRQAYGIEGFRTPNDLPSALFRSAHEFL